ncbi:hypothetical protein [Microcystis aeruginosa]|uniref:hypothetical protein n=1 Tax=Microcystis aeruginosa TaxID=1126 RepID=UPI000776490C|nr:hypothetical protein [Microcystis aeruginosa]KXS89961.1 hypothetical protein OA58_17820 [Microcystis aeruginosa NIES-88]BCU11687.1 hypothetical protein MAN88_22510 [Microcystis aeruginosa]
MKRLNYQNLLIASLLGLSTLFAGSYPLVKAQSEPKLGCQATVDKVLQEIRSKGVRRTWFKLYEERANENNTGNPTNRTDELHIILSAWDFTKKPTVDSRIQSIINNIMSSKSLLKSWADRIVVNCSNTAIVGFGNDQSDWGEDYYIQSDGTTKLNKCVKPENAPSPLPWGVSVCL